MARIFHEARFNKCLTNDLSRYVSGILSCRRRAFASWSKKGPLNPLSLALERFCVEHQALIHTPINSETVVLPDVIALPNGLLRGAS